MATPSSTSDSSLSTAFSKCLILYKRFLLALGEENCRVVKLEQLNVLETLEEYGRLKIWGQQTRAILSPSARSSLDDTLRNDAGLKKVVLDIFRRLAGHLEQGSYISNTIPIAERTYDESKGSDQDSISSVSASSGSSSDDDEPSNVRVPKISVLVAHIFEQIRSLYHLSMLLRRPGFNGKYIRSVNKNEEVSSESPFLRFDHRHVWEKVRQWHGLSQMSTAEEEEVRIMTEEDVQNGKNFQAVLPDEINMLCRRLGKANTRRREQLQYWAKNPDGNETNASALTVKLEPAGERSRSQVSTVKPYEAKTAHTVVLDKPTLSMTSRQSLSTVPRSAVDDRMTQSGRPRTTYARTTVGAKLTYRVPEVPKVPKGDLTFECPYCHLKLVSEAMQDRETWKRHIFRDLRPYVCTFANCHSPDKLYVTRHDWIYHEMQMHRRQWICGESGENCGQTFHSRELMARHLEDNHTEFISSRQMPVLLEMAERPAGEGDITTCPLCWNEMRLDQLQSHLAEHMEEIALFVLPTNAEDDEDPGSNKVVGLKSQAKACSDKAHSQSSLGFSNIDANQHPDQSSEDFAKLLATEELDTMAKCADWETGGVGVDSADTPDLTSTMDQDVSEIEDTPAEITNQPSLEEPERASSTEPSDKRAGSLTLEDIVEDLLEEAAAAENVASAFFPFLSKIHEYSAEISAVISELFGISSAFRHLAKGLKSRVSYPRLNRILDDIDLSLYKVYVTLSSVEYQLERLGITPDPPTAAFARVWREIQSTLRDGSTTFHDKLRFFKDFLLGLVDKLKGVRSEYDMRLLRQRLLDIRVRPGLDILMKQAFGSLSLADAGDTEPGQSETRLQRTRRSRRVPGPVLRKTSFSEDELPGLPLETSDASSMPPFTPVSTREHWALNIFDGFYPVTPFGTHDSRSVCNGTHVVDAEGILSRTSQRLLELDFEDGMFTVQLYWNPSDMRSTILCTTSFPLPHRTYPRNRQSYWLLSQLEVSRQETCLQLSRSADTVWANTDIVWARLRFRYYELMVLFFCTIVALRAQGPPDLPMKPTDYRLEGEVVLGEYKINDDDFPHTLRILKDRDSGGARLEAAVFSGELKDTPVWTAFITDQIGSPSWIRRTTPRVIQLPGLYLYVFSNEYSYTRQDQFELSFYKSEDALNFIKAFRSLRP